jgi:uncharacterized membrane protein
MKQARLLRILVLSSIFSVLFFLVRVFNQRDLDYWYLNWNLLLAWLPLLFSVVLVRRLRTSAWSSWQNITLSILWLGFLPNSFYIMTDFIHLQHTSNDTLLFDVVLLLSFTLNGLLLGYISTFLIHDELKKRFNKRTVSSIIAGVFLACSFAIYLGRYLRWNTWDVLINPAGLLFDVSDRFINPGAHGQTFTTTVLFFVFITGTYIVARELAAIMRLNKPAVKSRR